MIAFVAYVMRKINNFCRLGKCFRNRIYYFFSMLLFIVELHDQPLHLRLRAMYFIDVHCVLDVKLIAAQNHTRTITCETQMLQIGSLKKNKHDLNSANFFPFKFTFCWASEIFITYKIVLKSQHKRYSSSFFEKASVCKKYDW